jgi:hypothetical protein
MKTQRVLIVLTVLTIANAAMFSFSLVHPRNVAEAAPGVAPVLRGHALEIVDYQGRVRAELRVTPAQPEFKMPDGSKGFPEAVLFRLLTSQNGPNVKLTTTEDGSGLVLGGDPGYIQLIERGKNPALNFVNKDGRKKTIEP